MNLEDAAVGQIIHLPTGIAVTVDQLLETVASSRVIYVGETHDNLEAHRVQLEVIRRLYQNFPGRLAVGMEMFRRSAQDGLDRWITGTLPDREFEKLFRKNWGNTYKIYQPIFDYLKETGIPLLGLKSTEETQNRLRRDGLDITNSEHIFPEMDLDDVHHKAHTMAVFGGHSGPAGGSTGAYRMVVLWEETMAETIANFLKNETYRNWKLVVLTGGFHVQYAFGVPKRAFRRIPHAYSIILPTVTHVPPELQDREMEVEEVPIPLYSADFAWKITYKVLSSNRIRLGVFLEELDEGLRVKGVGKDSNAARAGIQKDDVLMQLDRMPLNGQKDLVERLQGKKIGDHATLKLQRAGHIMEVTVSFAENAAP
ncbi:MAG: ChaN family lipoprotein [Nitrospinota bacterium]|nr:ChaN family lipoprotein [Nitrospinota bacterium]